MGFDALGQRISMTDPTGTTTFTYDAASNVVANVAPQGAVTYGYDAANRRTSMTLPGSRTVSYGYDAANQLTSLTDWLNRSTTISYTPDGLRSLVTRPAGIKSSYAYDSADRLTSVNNDTASGALKDFSYTLDAAGNRTSMTSGAGTEAYTLDSLNRLTQVSYPNSDKVSYTYDAAGNRLTQTVNGTTTSYGYNAAGQLQTVGATTYSYDADGNLIGAGADSFSWDWAGRLTAAATGGSTSTYTYDGDGVRVAAKFGSAATTNYLWDRRAPLPLLVDDGSHGYVHSNGVMEQLDSDSSTAIYPLSDGLGSSRGVANSSGAVAGSADYDVFGAVRSQNGMSSIFGFTGQQTDATGMLYLRARYLNPAVGRFLSPDSQLPNGPGSQGYNLYSYAGNNATTMVDPSGHLTIEWATIARVVVLTAGVVAIGLALRNLYQASVCALSAGSICAPGYFPPRARGGSDGGGTTAADDLANQLLRGLAQLTKAAAVAAATACLASAAAGRLAPWGDNPCSGLKGPIFFSGSDNRETTEHISDAQSTGGKLAILSYWGKNRPSSSWYVATPDCNEAAKTQYASTHNGDRPVCDEYPFHSTNQNQESLATVSLDLVPSIEGPIQGGALSTFYGSYGCRINAGDEFAVVPVVVPVGFPVPVPSVGYCPGRP